MMKADISAAKYADSTIRLDTASAIKMRILKLVKADNIRDVKRLHYNVL